MFTFFLIKKKNSNISCTLYLVRNFRTWVGGIAVRCVTVNKLHGDGVVRYMLRSLAVTFLSVHEKHLLILHGCQIPRNADRVAASGAFVFPESPRNEPLLLLWLCSRCGSWWLPELYIQMICLMGFLFLSIERNRMLIYQPLRLCYGLPEKQDKTGNRKKAFICSSINIQPSKTWNEMYVGTGTWYLATDLYFASIL